MKKTLFTLLASGLFLTSFAAVNVPEGAVAPQTSTEAQPVWYGMMSSHLDATDRQNRWAYFDGETLSTQQFETASIGEDADLTQFAWRLEDNGDGTVTIVHYTGLELTVPDNASPTVGSNVPLTMTDNGASWTYMLSSETGQSNCAELQYAFDWTGWSGSGAAYLNAMGNNNNDTSYGLTIYEAGVHQASGWFFVPLTIESETPVEVAWTEVYSNTLSSQTSSEVNLTDDPVYASDGWSVQNSSATADPAFDGLSNTQKYGPYVKSPSEDQYLAIRQYCTPGTYKFSYLHKRGETDDLTAVLAYATSVEDLEAGNFAAVVSDETEVPKKKGSESGDLFESEQFEITEAGDYYFTYKVVSTGSAPKLRIADFVLSKVVVNYTVTWATPENGTLTVVANDAELTSPATVEEGTVLTITAVPADGYDLETLTVAGEAFESGATYTVAGDTEIAATFVEHVANPNTAISLHGNTTSSSDTEHNRFYFTDELLGSHTDGSAVDDNRTRTFTYSAWLKVNEARGRVMGFGQKQFWSPGPTFHLYIAAGGNYGFFNRCVRSDGSFGDDQTIVTSQAVEVGEWAFISMVFDAENNTRTIYYNGQEILSGEYNAEGLGMLPDESAFYIVDGDLGSNRNYADDPAVDLDEVQVWTRALSAEEVAASMTSVDPSSEGLAYLYRFGAERMNDDYTFDNLATSAASGDVKAAYYAGSINYNAASWATLFNGTVAEPTFVEGHTATPAPVTYSITWEDVEGATITVTDWNDQSITYNSGDRVEAGTQVLIQAEAADGYVLDGMTVNGEDFNQSTVSFIGGQNPYTVESNVVVAVSVHQEQSYTVTYEVRGEEGLGELEVIETTGYERIESGTQVPEGTTLEVNIYVQNDVAARIIVNDEVVRDYTADELYESYNMGWYNVENIQEDINIVVEFTSVAVETFPITWEAEHCAVEVRTLPNLTAVEFGEEVAAGTEISIVATPDEGYTLESLTVNGTEIESGDTYVVNEAVNIVAVVAGTGLDAVNSEAAHYDAASETLYVNGQQAVKVYDVTGRLVLDTEVESACDLSGLRDGIYVALVDGKALKFRK